VSDKTESALKREITRLRNIAKTKPMSLTQKLDVLEKAKAVEAKLRAHRIAKL
jgi:hypothetical protein